MVSLSLAEVAVLHASGDAAVTGMLARCKADVFHALDDANGFRDLGEDGASREALNAVRRARHAMGRVCGAVSRLLPRRLGARLARELLAAYAEKVAAAALALSDVSVDESDSLRGILVEAFDPRGLLVALPGTLASGGGRAAGQSVEHSFTPREASVLQLVAEGLMNKEIARQLETSIRNVEKYVSRLFAKTGTASRTELVRYALEHGLVQ